MSQIDVTSGVVAGPTGGGGYVTASALNSTDTFVFNTDDIVNKAFFVKCANSLDYFSPFTGGISVLDPDQTVLLVGVKAQIDG